MSAPDPGTLPAGRHNYGAGLSLLVSAAGSRSWSCRVTVAGSQRSFGLGPWPKVTEQVARDAMAAKWDALGVASREPRAPRPAEPAPATLLPVQRPQRPPAVPRRAAPAGGTFGAYAERVAAHKYDTLEREADAADWEQRVRRYCAALWDVPAVECTALRILDDLVVPSHAHGPSLPGKVLSAVRQVLVMAVLDGTIPHNPVEGKTISDGLKLILPPHRTQHHNAAPWEQAPALAAALPSGQESYRRGVVRWRLADPAQNAVRPVRHPRRQRPQAIARCAPAAGPRACPTGAR